MNQDHLYHTLEEFTEKQAEIHSAVLVSEQGQPITAAIGFEQDSILIVAGLMLNLAQQVQEEMHWSTMEQISVRSPQGYLTLVACTEGTFLLVKTTKTPTGLLEREIKQTVNQLSSIFDDSENRQLPQLKSENRHFLVNQNTFKLRTTLEADFIKHCQRELAEFIGPISKLVCQRILKKYPDLMASEFIAALAKQIPNPQQSQVFQQRLNREVQEFGKTISVPSFSSN